MVEPDDPPSVEDLAAPSDAVVPPHVKTMIHPLTVHIANTVDFRRPPPHRGGAADGIDGGGPVSGWPTRRFYPRGLDDAGTSAGSSGGPSFQVAGGSWNEGQRTLASGVEVTGGLAPRQKRRRKSGRRPGRKGKGKQRRAREAAKAAASADQEEDRATSGSALCAPVVGDEGGGPGVPVVADAGDGLEAGPPAPATTTLPLERSGNGQEGLRLPGGSGAFSHGAAACPIPSVRDAAGCSLPSVVSMEDGERGEDSRLVVTRGRGQDVDVVVPIQAVDRVASPPAVSQSLGLEAFRLTIESSCGPREEAVFQADGPSGQDAGLCDGTVSPILGAPGSAIAQHLDARGEDEVDEEIEMELPPPRTPPTDVVTGCAASNVTHGIRTPLLADPPLTFCRSRTRVGGGCPPVVARPRTLGEFLEAAKTRTDALLSTPAVRRRLLAMNFQPRRSSRIAGQPGGLNAESKAVRNLMRKLGLITGDEAPSEAALEAYHRMYEFPLTDEMIAAVAELYGWTLSTFRGCSPPTGGTQGGQLIEA